MIAATERVVRYQKACHCRGTKATSGEVRIKVADTSILRVRATLIEGPSCDACGKAWRKVADDDEGRT